MFIVVDGSAVLETKRQQQRHVIETVTETCDRVMRAMETVTETCDSHAIEIVTETCDKDSDRDM